MGGAVTKLFETRLETSAKLFAEYVWPLVGAKFGQGELDRVEGDMAPALRTFDRCGIDYLFRPESGEPMGIGQRTQVCRRSWDTFTMSTSGLLRLSALLGYPGAIVPTVLIHSYLRSGPAASHTVTSVGMVKTVQLVAFARSHPRAPRESPTSGAFFAWGFDELEEDGVHIDRFPSRAFRDPFQLARGEPR